MKVSIIGATGYTGEELLRIMANHPAIELEYITSESSTGEDIGKIYPHFNRFYHKKLASMGQLAEIGASSDVVFLGLPHGHAMDATKKLLECGARVIDLGADYRFSDPAVYEKWYKVPHTHRDAPSVYGLTELNRAKVKDAVLVGNPGCYTTASILALAPLVKHRLVDLGSLIVDAKSGVSGAGRSLSLGSHFSEVFESVKAYNIAGHRHTPEIEQALGELAGTEVIISFTPHLIPMTRGILSTCYAQLKAGVSAADVDAAYETMYGDEYFIRLLGRGGYPATKNTRGSNFCDLGWHLDSRTGRVVVVSAIDNLVKGAAGQAIQNLNVMFGLDERTGLMQAPMYP
ncbi:MAG: N-acetyl-gamma-glutamyl-phosphate reductase [Negativicutes bacterium]|nr:N-acetyl-gamma-glutamyl-phosphate reductase [Negativicutes bacterium]